MRRKRYTAPDGLDWRDPNMPVLRYGNVNGVIGNHLVASQHIQQYYKTKIDQLGWQIPDYKNDPSYWWNRKKK